MRRLFLILTLLFAQILMIYSQESNCNNLIERHTEGGGVRISSSSQMIPSIYKYIYSDKTIKYYLHVSLDDCHCTGNGTGLMIIFNDGTKFKRNNAKINMDYYYNCGMFTYSVILPLTMDEVEMFSQKEIKKLKMYIFEKKFAENESETFKKFVNCLIKTE